MSSLRFEPAPRPTRFSCIPQGDGSAEDWIGRWANSHPATVVVNIAGLNAPSREYDIVVREQLSTAPGALLRHTFVQIFESRSAASQFPHIADDLQAHWSTPPAEQARTLLLPEYGILLRLYRLVEHSHGQWPDSYSTIVHYRRPATPQAPAADLMLRQTPRLS